MFGDCPISHQVTFACLSVTIDSGEVKLGGAAIVIKKAIQLQAGLPFLLGPELLPAADGNTLSKTPEPVPGGLTGLMMTSALPSSLQEAYRGYATKGMNEVTETTELVGTGSIEFGNFIFGHGIGLALPVRIKLDNPFLGSGCYIGSHADPVELEMTTGETSPIGGKVIKGSPGIGSTNKDETIIFAKDFSTVSNSYAVSGATGCGGIYSSLIDRVVNLKLGLPAPAGGNTVILGGDLSFGSAEAVSEERQLHP